ncbi:MAG: teichuronic acid biosynthesis glycosyltransferase TuaG, partial [Psychroserpens sp.]
MISVILPFFNSDQYLEASIDSVINQSIDNWELLLINDGSTDHSKTIALSFADSRIRYFEQKNRGVSAARNLGLANMKGDYFCFLDSDDVFPSKSLESRILVFENSTNIDFVDGVVRKMDQKLNLEIEKWSPNFFGNPLHDLVKLTGKSFLGLTWMIKKKRGKKYQLQEGLTHCEDLYFYLQLSLEGGKYSFTNEVTLFYRDNPASAMKNLLGLKNGYRFIESKLNMISDLSFTDKLVFKYKFRKAMMLAFLKKREFF